MTTAEMLTAIRDRLAADQGLVDWCVSEFGRAPTIQVDYDDQAEVPADCYPLVAVVRVGRRSGPRAARLRWSLDFAVFVSNSERQVATAASGARTVTYPGRLAVEGLREQVEAALDRARLGKLEFVGEELSATFHPRYVSPFTVEIENVNNIT